MKVSNGTYELEIIYVETCKLEECLFKLEINASKIHHKFSDGQ